MRRADFHNKVASLAGFEYSENANDQKFTKNNLRQLCKCLGLDTGGSVRDLRRRIAEETGLKRFNCFSNNQFGRHELKKIISCLEE